MRKITKTLFATACAAAMTFSAVAFAADEVVLRVGYGNRATS